MSKRKNKRRDTTYNENKEEKEIEELSESDKNNDIKDESLSAGLSAQAGLPVQVDEEAAEDEKEELDEDGKDEIAGEATFQKGTNSKTSLILIIMGIIVVSLVLFTRTNEGKNILDTIGLGGESAVLEKYVNPIHKYGFEFESNENSQLVVAGNIPAELGLKGVESMQDLNLTDGDALLIRTDTVSKDNIVYTVLELSKRGGYITFDEYLEALRVNLGNTTATAGTEYVEKESIAGKEKLPAVEFSFEMDVLTDQESMETRVGVFYDTVFEAGDNAYSISFGYPKDIENAKYYIDLYSDMVASFTYDEEIDEETDEKVDSVSDDPEGTEEEAEIIVVPEGGEIETEVVE